MTMPGATRAVLITPPGTGAIAVVRLSGFGAAAILADVFHPTRHSGDADSGPPDPSGLFRGGRLRYGRILDGGEVIDDAVVSLDSRAEPPAYDLCLHGGVRIVERVLALLTRCGAELGDADANGESPWAASDLIEQEVFTALTRAKTERAVRFLCDQRARLRAEMESLALECRDGSASAYEKLRAIGKNRRATACLVDGCTVAILGPPNAGKSTLFNHLVGRSATLVSDTSGTTRDWVSAEVELDGVPVTLVDTAGQRSRADALEQLAGRAGWQRGLEADVCVLLVDGSQRTTAEDRQRLRRVLEWPQTLGVINKSDLPGTWRPEHDLAGGPSATGAWLPVSASSGDGVAALVKKLLDCLGFADWHDDAPSIFTSRQHAVLAEVISTLPRSGSAAARMIRKELMGLPASGDAGS